MGDEVGGHGGGAIAGEAQVVLIGAALVGVDADLERLDPRVAGERARDLVEERVRLRLQRGLAGLERDRLAQLETIGADDDAAGRRRVGVRRRRQRRQRR